MGFLLLLLGLAVYLVAAFSFPLTRGEAMYALIPAEMLAAGQWIAPILNGVPFLDKPPLLYWINLLSFQVFGVSDWAARLPTLALTLGEIWVTFLIGRLLFSNRAAKLGAFILLTSLGFFSLHLALYTDHLITLSLGLALYALLRWRERPELRWVLLFHFCLAAGFLSKSLIGLAFPLLIGSLYAWQSRQPRLCSLFFHPGGLALAGFLIVPWFAAMEHYYPWFWWHQLVNENLLRFLGQRQANESMVSLPLFWLFLGVWLMPWTVLLPEAVYRYLRGGWKKDCEGAGVLLIIWPAVILGVFSLSSLRIEYYSLPALPALALILGWRLDRYLASPRDAVIPVALLVLALIFYETGFLLRLLEESGVGSRREFMGILPSLRPLAHQVSLIIPFLALLGVFLGRRHRLAVGAYGALALALLFFTYQAHMILAPQISDKVTGEYVRRHCAEKDLAVMESQEEYEYGASFAFYACRHILMVKRNDLPRFPYRLDPQKDYLISPAKLKDLWQGPRRLFLLVDDAMPLEAYLKGSKGAIASGGKTLLVNRPQGIKTEDRAAGKGRID